MKQNHEGKWCWGLVDGENYEGDFDHEWQAHAAAHDYASPGDKLQYEVAQKTHPLNLVTDQQIFRQFESMLEGIDMYCHDQVGGDDIVLQMADVDNKPLIDFVRSFIKDNAKVSRWGTTNVKIHNIITSASSPQFILPVEVQRDENGHWWHPDMPSFDEGDAEKSRAWTAQQGLEISWSDLDGEYPDTPASIAYFDNDDTNISSWNPAPPAGDGWFTLGIDEADDGPRWWWARRVEGGAQ